MGFLSRFRRKKETEAVSPREACARIGTEIEGRERKLVEEGARFIERIRECREKLRSQFLELEKKQLPSGLPSNTAGIVRKLKTVLIRKVVQELDSIKKQSPDYAYFERFMQVKREIIKWSVKNRAAMVVVDEGLAREIGKSLKEMDDIGREAERLLRECDTRKLREIQNEIENALEDVEHGLEKQKKKVERTEELINRIKEREKELAQMEEGEEKETYLREKENKARAEQELGRSMADLNSELSLLGRPLKKFGRVCAADEIERMVTRYANEPVKTLLDEGPKYPMLRKILEKLSPLVGSGEIELKERVREKTTEKMRSIASGSLENRVSETHRLKAITEKGIDNGIMDRIREKNREIEGLKEELSELEGQRVAKKPDWEEIESRLKETGIDLKLSR